MTTRWKPPKEKTKRSLFKQPPLYKPTAAELEILNRLKKPPQRRKVTNGQEPKS